MKGRCKGLICGGIPVGSGRAPGLSCSHRLVSDHSAPVPIPRALDMRSGFLILKVDNKE